MTAKLASPFNEAGIDYSDPANKDRFFSFEHRDEFRIIQSREFLSKRNPAESCNTNLFFGFFQDGTRNNYGKSIEAKNYTHTNIARLYSCFPGRSVPGVVPGEPQWEHERDQFNHFFRVYTPGVGSAFDRVGDTGAGMDDILGAAAGYKGEPRIVWTLLQAINNLHRFFRKDEPLLMPIEAKALCATIRLNRRTLERMTDTPPLHFDNQEEREQFSAQKKFTTLLRRLHKAIEYNMIGPNGARPRNPDPGLVQQIYVSIFGFSRTLLAQIR